MTLLTKLIVLASLAGALAFEAYQGRFLYPYLPALTVLAALLGFAGGRFARNWTSAAILILAYWFPLIFVFLSHRPFLPPHFVIWNAALAGVIASDDDTLAWSYPARWRLALVLWAVTVALGWPLVTMREVDFESFNLLERYRVSNSGLGGSPMMTASWLADVATLHLLGLLWFDTLFRWRGRMNRDDVARWIARPLAIGAATGAALALYQGAIDVGFLSGGLWPSMGRAAGPLLDANASGIIFALWSAALLAFAIDRRARVVSIAGAVLCWAGLWMTGSRTALLAAIVGLVPIAIVVGRHMRTRPMWRRELAAGTVVVAVVGGLVLTAAPGPLKRLRYMPTFAGDRGVDWLAHEFWDRSSYGGAAAALTASHPVVGIGVGMFQMMGADYIRRTVHQVVPDNAQNWWRHQIVELGVLGAAGVLLWTALFGVYLVRSPGTDRSTLETAALKGALIGMAAASLVGMPTQSTPVAITFWTLAFWFTHLADGDTSTATGGLRSVAWIALAAVVSLYLITTFVQARGSLRPARRAADGGWPYVYGMYEPPTPKDGQNGLWTEAHGVATVAVGGPIMILTVRAEHPDLAAKPVRAVVDVAGRNVLDMKLGANVPVVRQIDVGDARQVIIEAHVDRTWRAEGVAGDREVGLSLSWSFINRE